MKMGFLDKLMLKVGYEKAESAEEVRNALVSLSEQNLLLVTKVNELEEENISLSQALTATNKKLTDAEKKAEAVAKALEMARKFEENKKAFFEGGEI